MASNKVIINGYTVWYDKSGSGTIPLILIPGAIGTGQTDFRSQLYGENALDKEKFTLITVDLPGWGRSRPPVKTYNKDIFNTDAEICVKLMNHLGYSKFSILGWSYGAEVAIVLTVNFPDSVETLVIGGILYYITDRIVKSFIPSYNINNWPYSMIQNYLHSYEDQEDIQQVWSLHMKFTTLFLEFFPKGITNDNFEPIKCPVLILHGDKDGFVPLDQPLYLMKKIKGAKLHRFPTGTHHFHQQFAPEIKKLVEDFVVQPNLPNV